MRTLFWRRGFLTAAALVSTLSLSAAHAAPCSIVIRDDDGAAEAWLVMNFGDDTAIKQLDVGLTALLVGGNATLKVFARSTGCPTPGFPHKLTANGVLVSVFDGCLHWGASPGWASFSIPSGVLSPGTNTFSIWDASHWTTGNIVFGIDQNNNFGRTTATEFDGTRTIHYSGELMWYLEIRDPLVCV